MPAAAAHVDNISTLFPIPGATCWLPVCNVSSLSAVLSSGLCCVTLWSICMFIFVFKPPPKMVTWGDGRNQQEMWPLQTPRETRSRDTLQEMKWTVINSSEMNKTQWCSECISCVHCLKSTCKKALNISAAFKEQIDRQLFSCAPVK